LEGLESVEAPDPPRTSPAQGGAGADDRAVAHMGGLGGWYLPLSV